jgi:beta-glucosidase
MKSDASGRQAASDAVSGVCKKSGPVVEYNAGDNVDDAVKLAKDADAVLVFVATSSSEGHDRGDLSLGNQDALIEAVAKVAGSKTAVIAVTPGALLTPWRDSVSAILTPLMPGQQYGNAISDVIFGDANPGGKLPITFPTKENEMNMTQEQWPGVQGISYYSEGLEVGYRWYDAHKVQPAYPFGHGLSYSKFEYSNLKVHGRTVSCTVKNTGAVDGSEAAQLYLQFPSAAGEPPKQLKGLQKLRLAAGKSTTAEFKLNDRSFSIWDVKSHQWSVVPGKFDIMIGSSSRDIRLTSAIQSVEQMSLVV